MTDREIEHLCDLAWQEKYFYVVKGRVFITGNKIFEQN